MFRNCLIGSICLHILILVGVGLCLPRLYPPSPQTAAYFDIVGNLVPNQGSTGGVGKSLAGKPGGNSLALVKPGVEANPSRRSPIVSPGPVKQEADVKISPGATVLAAAGEGPGITGSAETPSTAVQSGSSAGYASGTGDTIGILDGSGIDDDGKAISGRGGTGERTVYGAGGTEGEAPDIPPQKTFHVSPVYPEVARRNNWEGDTVLQALISSGGKPGLITVVSSSGYSLLDRAAIGAVRRWRYRSAYQGGKPVACYIRITIHFKLED